MEIYKKINKGLLIVLIILDIILVVLTEPSLNVINKGLFNVYETSLLEPLFYSSFPLFFILIFLLLFKPLIFKHWLIFIASWYIPVSVYLVSQISINSSNILATDRSTTSLVLMVGLFGLTVLFVVVHYLIEGFNPSIKNK